MVAGHGLALPDFSIAVVYTLGSQHALHQLLRARACQSTEDRFGVLVLDLC